MTTKPTSRAVKLLGSIIALAFTLCVSLAANITWAARDLDPVAIAAGIATPITLVLAVHQWRSHLHAQGWQRVLRLLAMAAVTGTAASWTWVHTTRLLLEHNIESPLAYIAPLAIDGLAVMSTMTLWGAAPTDQEEVREEQEEFQEQLPDLQEERADQQEETNQTAPRHAAGETVTGETTDEFEAIVADLVPDNRTALERAEEWYKNQLRDGREPTATAVNIAVNCNSYIKGHHLRAWREQLADEATTHG